MAAPVYKQFCLFRTALYVLAAALFLIVPMAARAASDPAYTIEGVEVDVRAKNAVIAREKALEEAQSKAYQMLAERFLSPEEMKTFKAPDPITLSTLVQDFEVTNEQLSTTRYKGTYTIRFRPNAMRSQMASQGKVLGAPRKPVLVLPFYEMRGRTALWGDANPWMRAWRNLPADGVVKPTVLPLGDAQDMTAVADVEGLQYDPVSVQELAARYGADDVAILLASAVPTSSAQGRLVVNIYNNGFNGPTFVQKITLDQNPGETEDALFTRAADQAKPILRGEWKANAAYNPAAPVPGTTTTTTTTTTTHYGQHPAAPPGVPVPYTRPALGTVQPYTMVARFASVQDWVRMKNTLDRVYGMQAVMVKTLKQRDALLDVRFAGNLSDLQVALQNAGIMMRAGNGGPLEIHLNVAVQQPIYGN